MASRQPSKQAIRGEQPKAPGARPREARAGDAAQQHIAPETERRCKTTHLCPCAQQKQHRPPSPPFLALHRRHPPRRRLPCRLPPRPAPAAPAAAPRPRRTAAARVGRFGAKTQQQQQMITMLLPDGNICYPFRNTYRQTAGGCRRLVNAQGGLSQRPQCALSRPAPVSPPRSAARKRAIRREHPGAAPPLAPSSPSSAPPRATPPSALPPRRPLLAAPPPPPPPPPPLLAALRRIR